MTAATSPSAPKAVSPGPELAERFSRAAREVGGVVERRYEIGDTSVTLRFAGEALLERLTPTLSHLLATEPAGLRPAHTVEIWDGESTGTEPPPTPAGSESLPPAGLATMSGEGWRAVFQPGLRALSLTDIGLGRSWYWVASAVDFPEWECSTPMRHILQPWLASAGVQTIHAGAVGLSRGGFIVVGRSGSGKSTTTLSTLGSDLVYAGDDYVGISLDEAGNAFVHSIYSCGKLEQNHVARFPSLRFHPHPERADAPQPWRLKTIFYVPESYPEQMTKGFPLKGVVVPKVVPEEETRLTELPRTAALKELAAGTMFEIHGAGSDALATIARVTERSPAFQLRLGRGLENVPRILSDALVSL